MMKTEKENMWRALKDEEPVIPFKCLLGLHTWGHWTRNDRDVVRNATSIVYIQHRYCAFCTKHQVSSEKVKTYV